MLLESVVEDCPQLEREAVKERSLCYPMLLGVVGVMENVNHRVFEKREPHAQGLTGCVCLQLSQTAIPQHLVALAHKVAAGSPSPLAPSVFAKQKVADRLVDELDFGSFVSCDSGQALGGVSHEILHFIQSDSLLVPSAGIVLFLESKLNGEVELLGFQGTGRKENPL